MKLLFVMRHPAAVRALGGMLRMLDERGHRVHLAFSSVKPEAHRVLRELVDECEGITFGPLPSRGAGERRARAGWDKLSERLRTDSDYLRYLEPRYADATGLRARAERRAHPAIRRLARRLRPAGPRGVRALRSSLRLVERCLVPPPHIARFVADQEPDAVLVTHLARDSVQADCIRAAKRLGIHTGYPVFSWDNLSNKGLVHELPELVLVWNDIQAGEAVELQDIPRELVEVTGAPSYDHWFDWKPARSLGELCREIGLRADRPILLYVCSSVFVAPDEVAFVRRWIAALRAHGGALAEAGVLVRPHPRNAAQWVGVMLDDPQTTVWPQLGEEPLEAASRQNYFDSIYHAAAVVGINTSAQIESAIVGRPVHTVLADEFRETQQGTIHFHYLKDEEFGHVKVGLTMDDHLAQLERSVRGDAGEDRNERFVRRFVRPFGLDVAATPLLVEKIEELAARPAPAPDRGPALAPAVRLVLAPVAALVRRSARRRKAADGSPGSDLRRAVRRLKREQVASTVVAGPWLQDEIGELLYWIPFLRWAQAATFGLRDRLVVVSRAASAPWYAGIGSEHVRAEEELAREQLAALTGTTDVAVLSPSLVDDRRGELAARHPDERFLHRLLEFAPLPAGELPAGLELPDDFLAVHFDAQQADVAAALADRRSVVSLADLERPAQAAVLAHARGFVGSYGVGAYLAALSGVEAVGLYSSRELVAPDDLRLARSFLRRPTFGRLHAIEASGPPGNAAERAAALLEETQALAPV